MRYSNAADYQPDLFINRELSLVEFNPTAYSHWRAMASSAPCCERLRF